MIERMLIRTFVSPLLYLFIGPTGSELVGRCPTCQGPAKLVRVGTVDGNITSHQAIEGINCDHFIGAISVIKYKRS